MRPQYHSLLTHLGEIRLVKIRRGYFDSPIELEMIQGPLSRLAAQRGYQALSYTWGDAKDTRQITLNGQPFHVTKNLEAALRHLRSVPGGGGNSQEIVLWIDALCINQKDIEERNAQVRRMLDIYKSATRVIVWLGEGTEDSDKAMIFMNQYSTTSATTKEQCDKINASLAEPGQFEDEWRALAQGILVRPWWSRVWIVQEVVAAKATLIVCGKHTVDWDVLSNFEWIANHYHTAVVAEVLRRVENRAVRSVDQAEHIGAIRHKYRAGKPLLLHQLAHELRLFQATLPVDKLYAYYGLCVDSNFEDLNPDYDKPAWQVYAQFTRHVVLRYRKLDFICAGINLKTLEGLPSWVPDLYMANDQVPNPLKGRGHLMDDFLYKASSDRSAEVSFSEDLRVMRATGILVNPITSLSPYWDPHLSTQDFFREFIPATAKWGELIKEQSTPLLKRYGSPSFAQKAFEKTLTADRLLSVRDEVSRFANNQSVIDVLSIGIPDEFEPGQSLDRRDYLWQMHVAFWYRGTLQDRTLAVLTEGYMGLVPKLAKVDDIVCILFGCDTPVVLRPIGNDFVFIGECYIHGIMDGELMKGYEEGSTQSKEFVIK